MTQPIETHKQICRALAAQIGWSYGGWDEGFYCFQKGNYEKGFCEMRLIETDLTLENIVNMARHGLSR